MGYIGVQPKAGFTSGLLDRFTSTTGTTVTLTHDIASENDIIVFVNFVKQDSTNYSVGGTGNKTLTLGGTLVSSDVVEVHYINAVKLTQAPSANSVGISQLNVSDGTNGQVLKTNGSGTLSFGDDTGGKIGQVVTTTFTGTESTTSKASDGSFTDSSVFASLTPSATSSKIMVMATINAGSTSSSNGVHVGRFTQAISGGSTTAVFVGASASNRILTSSGRGTASTNENTILTNGFNFVLTPSTTSAVTVKYQFAIRGASTGTAYINRSATDSDTTEYQRTASAITLMEILA